jgi:hypothetical protein
LLYVLDKPIAASLMARPTRHFLGDPQYAHADSPYMVSGGEVDGVSRCPPLFRISSHDQLLGAVKSPRFCAQARLCALCPRGAGFENSQRGGSSDSRLRLEGCSNSCGNSSIQPPHIERRRQIRDLPRWLVRGLLADGTGYNQAPDIVVHRLRVRRSSN